MVESARLEIEWTLAGPAGSNPAPSATVELQTNQEYSDAVSRKILCPRSSAKQSEGGLEE